MKWRLTFLAIVALCYACVAWIPIDKPELPKPMPGVLSSFVQAMALPADIATNGTQICQLSVAPASIHRRVYIFCNDNNVFMQATIHFIQKGQDVLQLPYATNIAGGGGGTVYSASIGQDFANYPSATTVPPAENALYIYYSSPGHQVIIFPFNVTIECESIYLTIDSLAGGTPHAIYFACYSEP